MQVDCFPKALPEWPRRIIGELAKVNPSYKLDKRKAYPFVEMSNVAEHFGGIVAFDARYPESSGLARFKEDDILFGKITPCAENGKVARVQGLQSDFGIGSTEFIVLSPTSENDPRFVYALLCSHSVHGRAVSRMEGSTGRLRITEDTFTKWLVVPRPPRHEQERIAQILGAVDTAITRTRDALAKAERLKRGVLARAFSNNNASRRRLGEFVIEIRYGTSQAANDHGWGYPTLRIPNVIGNEIKTDDLVYVDAADKDAKRFGLRANDLLLVRTNGNPNYIGRSAVFQPPDDRHWLYASYLICVRLSAAVIPEYVNEFLNAEIGRRELLRRVTTSAGNYNINTKNIESIPIPVLEEAEQVRVVNLAKAANARISSIGDKINVLQRLKRGLMQDLLTGHVQVARKGQSSIELALA